MAERRLQWNQLNVSAPNTAGLFAASGRALNDAADAAQGILANYESGQQEKADNELLRRIGGLDQDGLRTAFANGEFDDLNLSENGRGILNSAMGDRANIAGVNARTANTRATTGINLAREADTNRGRDQAYSDDQAIRAAAGDIYAAQDFAEQYGNTVGPITQTSGTLQAAYDGLIARGMPAHIAEGFVMNFQDESGGRLDITEGQANVHGTFGKGLYQLTGDRRDAFEARYGANGYTLDNQLDWLMHELETSERGARDSIYATGTAGEAGASIVSNFLRPAEEHRAERANRYINSSGQVVTERATPVQVARDRLIAAGLRPDQIDSALSGVTSAADERETELIELDAQASLDERLGMARDLVTSSAITSQQDMAQAIFNGPLGAGLGAREQAQLLEAATGLAAAAPGLLAPAGQEEVTGLNTSADVLVSDLSRAAASDQSTARLVEDVRVYAGSDDPFGSMLSDVDLDGSGERRSGISDEEYRQWGRHLADEFQVPESVVAAAMRENFVEDPGDDGEHWWDVDWTKNTPERQFAEDAIRTTVEKYLDAGAMSQFTERQSGRDRVEQQIQNLLGQQQNLQIRMRKARTPEERRELQAALSELQLQMSAIRSENQGLFSRSN